jgi:hypothetical protein
MSSSSSQPPRRRPNSALPRPRSVAGGTQARLRLTSPTPTSESRSSTRRIGRTIVTWAGWPTVGRLTTWVGAVTVAVAAIAGLWFTGNQYGLTEQGQVTDRFTKAIEQLGSDKLDIRLGAIYSLERLARDSKGDRPTIMEVLAAYVREHAPAPATPTLPSDVAAVAHCPIEQKGPPIDIRAVATVIGRRNANPTDPPIDLTNSCLSGPERNSSYGANLTNAYLPGVDLSGSDLTSIYLDGANLSETGGPLYRHAEFYRANASGAFLSGANLTGAGLEVADLTDTAMVDSVLTRASFSHSNLTRVWFFHADLTSAFFGWADLTGTNFEGANIKGADFTKAVNLDKARLNGVIYDSSTKWPNGFTPPPPPPPPPSS